VAIEDPPDQQLLQQQLPQPDLIVAIEDPPDQQLLQQQLPQPDLIVANKKTRAKKEPPPSAVKCTACNRNRDAEYVHPFLQVPVCGRLPRTDLIVANRVQQDGVKSEAKKAKPPIC
jgi:hypothetical protein